MQGVTFQVVAAGAIGRSNLAYDAIAKLGLLASLKLCVDARDAASYAGSGQSWSDRSGASGAFNLGSGSGSDSADPTFTGTAGSLAAYFAHDGGDYFTYSAANPTWVQNLHKASAKWSGFAALYGKGSGTTTQGFAGTVGGSSSNIGFRWTITSSGNLQLAVYNAGSTVLSQTSSSGVVGHVNNDTWNVVGFGLDDQAARLDWMLNGLLDSGVGTYSSPSASNATYTLQLGARGNADSPLVSGSRTAIFALWEGVALTAAQLSALFEATRGGFGL